MRFKDGREKNLSSYQLAIGIVEKIPAEKEPEVTMNPEIPLEKVTRIVLFLEHLVLREEVRTEAAIGSWCRLDR